jgi:predicted nucleic acid-binding protein
VFSVVLDTCVLYSAPLRDSLRRMALDGLFRPLWSDDILDELVRVLPESVSDEGRKRIRALMEKHFPDANVQGYSPLIPAMTNHEGDRHVLAAGVRANAGAIVTFNLKDFDAASREPYSIDLLHPDEFLVNQLGLAPCMVVHVLRRMVDAYTRQPNTLDRLADHWARASCPCAAEELRRQAALHPPEGCHH